MRVLALSATCVCEYVRGASSFRPVVLPVGLTPGSPSLSQVLINHVPSTIAASTFAPERIAINATRLVAPRRGCVERVHVGRLVEMRPPPPPAAVPALLVVADWLTWVAFFVTMLLLTGAAILMVADGHCRIAGGNRRSAIVWSLRGIATLSLASAFAPYYAEARFSVLTSYTAAGVNNVLIRLWNDAPREQRNPLHFALWVYISCAVAVAAAMLAAAELLAREQREQLAPAFTVGRTALNATGRRSSWTRRFLWHVGNSKLSLALTLVIFGTFGIVVGKTIDRVGNQGHWGVDWDATQHRGRAFWQQTLERSSFYAGFAGLLPMSLLGIPLGRTSAMWRAAGRSYEEAIAFHRALGHLMMLMYTWHGVGCESKPVEADRMLPCPPCCLLMLAASSPVPQIWSTGSVAAWRRSVTSSPIGSAVVNMAAVARTSTTSPG